MRSSVHNLMDEMPISCPSCGSGDLRRKVSFVTGLKKIKDGDVVRCNKCNWVRMYRNLPGEKK